MNKPKTSLEVGIDSLGNYTPADWRLEAEKGIISALVDQKAKIRKWLHNWLDNKYKDNDLWKLSETELYELLLKEFEELK